MPLPSLPFRLTRPPPDAGLAEALLRLLERPETDWDDIARQAMRDPALTLSLLWMAPLEPGEAPALAPALSRRLARAGRPLMRTWLMHAGSLPVPMEALRRASAHALLVAETAMHLAIEQRYARPDEAYLAGLWRGTGELSLLASAPDYAAVRAPQASLAERRQSERQRFGTDHVQLAAALATHCGLPRVVADAVALAPALEEHVAAAHPLAAILRAAECLNTAAPRLDEAVRLSGLDQDSLTSLRTDVAYLSAQGLQEIGVGLPVPAGHKAPAAYPVLPPGWRTLTLAGLMSGLFDGEEAEGIRRRLADAFRLLFGKSAPLMLVAEAGRIVPLLPDAPRIATEHLAELGLRADDDTSVVALAIRTQSATSHFPGADGPGRSTRDWHLTRWLGASGILCLPWQHPGDTGVAVLGIDESLDITTDEQQLMARLVAQAAAAMAQQHRQQRELAQLSESLQGEQRERARRLTHEINSPLTVIKSYLGMIGQRESTDPTLNRELALVSKEIDRVGALLRQLNEAPGPREEPAAASVNEVVGDLQRLYGEPLFASQGRELDIRMPAALPRVAMPASALKQVLLNLMRNAAEALPAGRRLSISSPGMLIADGAPSLEIRLLDNGPGLPEARLRRLFEPAPSSKGSAHQGVGLAIVKDILAQSGAYILCRSQPNQGTSFQIFIPLEATH
jgi:signal transduction histidine kinase